ncbi:hypothetical protein UO65_0804 [Actinokineospora spheciospongiae]|uniref:XRE family transcriptional regulator n=1 Tax=Actinokineospora spheciospongiae TaxID=909613 RepID=W7JD05_9PSEU|nr:hypothetical protein UO65_0804 [Actinokineospora spheciospongiae]
MATWESGEHEPLPHMRPLLADLLGVDAARLDDMINEAERPSSRAAGAAADERVRRSQGEWLAVRRAAARRGRELSELAAWLYPESVRAWDGHVLAGPGWLLDTPIPLEDVRLEFDVTHPAAPPLTAPLDGVLPLTDRGERYPSYSRAVRDLVLPRLLENRVSYRLLDVRAEEGLALRFGTTTFFEVFDVKEYVAHEFKAAFVRSRGSVPRLDDLPIRAGVPDPFDPHRWLVSPGISTLTIRHDPVAGHRFTLHQRDPTAVADGGGMCSVVPSGEFQSSTTAATDVRNDFSLWHNIMREYSEEFLGNPEHDGAGTRAIDYAHEEPFTADAVARLQPRLSSGSASLLRTAWRDRDLLLAC